MNHGRLIDTSGVEKVKIRSVLTCESKSGICIACYGRNSPRARASNSAKPSASSPPSPSANPALSLPCAPSISAVCRRASSKSADQGKFDGAVHYNELRLVELEDGNNIVLNKMALSHPRRDGRELETIMSSSVPSFPSRRRQGQESETFVQWTLQRPDSFRESWPREVPRHHRGRHMKQEMDEQTSRKPCRHRAQRRFAPADRHPR